MPEKTTMTAKELAEELGISTWLLYDLLRQGRIPGRRLNQDPNLTKGGKWLLLRDEVRRWQAAGCPGLSTPTRAAAAVSPSADSAPSTDVPRAA